jgi:hypothetical protein
MYGTVGTHRRPSISGVQEVAPYVAFDHFTTLGGTLVTRSAEAGVRIDFMSGATLDVAATRRRELVETAFSAGAGTIPTGGYDFDEASLSFQSTAGRPFSANVRVSGGGFFNGNLYSTGGGFRWLINHRLAINGAASYNRIELPEGGFNSSVYSGRVKYGFSTRLLGSLNVQYNEVTNQLVTYGRVNMIHAPLSDFFVVFSERRQLGSPNAVLERTLTAKITKLVSL